MLKGNNIISLLFYALLVLAHPKHSVLAQRKGRRKRKANGLCVCGDESYVVFDTVAGKTKKKTQVTISNVASGVVPKCNTPMFLGNGNKCGPNQCTCRFGKERQGNCCQWLKLGRDLDTCSPRVKIKKVSSPCECKDNCACSKYKGAEKCPKSWGESCVWSAWLEKCQNVGELVRRTNLADFNEELTKQGDEGKHLVAVDFSGGVWMGYFEELPGTYRWVTRTDFNEFYEENVKAMNEGYRAEAMAAGDGTHLAWFRKASPNVLTNILYRSSNSAFDEALSEMMSKDMHMTAALGNDNGVWLGWFEKLAGQSRWAHVYTVEDFREKIKDFWDTGYYVTSVAHSEGDGWVLWGEKIPGSSKWATRLTASDLWDWIVDNWEGHCVSAITHGCDA